MIPTPDDTLTFTDLGPVPYAPALALQRELHARVVAGDAPPTVLFVEHDPVITISHRKTAAQHLLASRDLLAKLGIAVEETDRGGDITYHGPGQLVAYPIIPLNPLGLNVGRYMRLLETIVIEALATFGVRGIREACATGVWVEAASSELGVGGSELGDESSPAACGFAPRPLAKVAALGVRVSRGVTLHGLALNVNTNLDHFNLIVPCGLVGRPVTSLHALLGEQTPDMESVKCALTQSLRQHLSAPSAPGAPGTLGTPSASTPVTTPSSC